MRGLSSLGRSMLTSSKIKNQKSKSNIKSNQKGIFMEEYKNAKFPSYYTKIVKAFPKNKSSYFVAGVDLFY